MTGRPRTPLDRPAPLAAAPDRHSAAFPGARLPCLRGIGGAGGEALVAGSRLMAWSGRMRNGGFRMVVRSKRT